MPKPPSPQQKLVDAIDIKLAPLGHFRALRMFSGYGLYLDGVIFGLVARDRLWLRVDDRSRPDFQKAGMEPFAYSRDGSRSASPISDAPTRFWPTPPSSANGPRKPGGPASSARNRPENAPKGARGIGASVDMHQ
jgi:DNA transformation protein